MTPFECWFGQKPNLGHLRIFGCRCYAHIEKENRQKLDSHTIEGIFLGYYATERLFAVYDIARRVIIKKRDVVFCEHVLGHPSLASWGIPSGTNILGVPVSLSPTLSPSDSDCEMDLNDVPPTSTNLDNMSLHVALQGLSVHDAAHDNDFPVHHLATNPLTLAKAVYQKFDRSPKRSHVISSEASLSDLARLYTDRYDFLLRELDVAPDAATSVPIFEDDPTSWRAAMSSPNRFFWLKAAYDELRQVVSMGTFELTSSLPSGRRALPSKWVWKTKKLPDGTIHKFKARWVVRGDLQRKGVDYFETFAPVANLISLRILLTVVCVQDLELDQLDVVSAFLNGLIDTTVFLHQPQGFVVRDGHYCLLRKSLYGLCQAAKTWYDRLDNVLRKLGYLRLMSDLAVWVVKSPSLHFVAAHVDDMLLGGTRVFINKTKQHLQEHFAITDMGCAKLFIGLKLFRDRPRRLLYLDQSHYARDILDTYHMSDCNPCLLPMNPALPEERLSDSEKRTYQAIIGSLGYLMNCSPPDLSFSVNRLAQFSSAPSSAHLLAAKHVLRYVKRTQHSRLLLGPDSVASPSPSPASDAPPIPGSLTTLHLKVYFDGSWADNRIDSRSTFGYCIVSGARDCLSLAYVS